MGMKNKVYDPKERPNISKFQLAVGISQIERCELMTEKRRNNSKYLQNKLKNLENIKVINDHFKKEWNHQYFVIYIKKNFHKIVDQIFKNGIHAMDENVWNCLNYDFKIENYKDTFDVTEKFDGSLLRLQNNSFLTKREMDKIANIIIKACDEN